MPTTYAIPDGRTVMAATTYTGTNANLTVSNAVNGVSMQPDLVWMKARSSAFSNTLTDSVRGVSKQVFSNLTNAETTESGKGLTAFNSNGFTLGPDLVTTGSTNASGTTYVAWQWQAGQGSTSSNTSGSITSTVSVNATAGFSVVTYTGTGANATVGHGLGVAPKMLILKRRNASSGGGSDWPVWHTTLSGTQYLSLSGTGGIGTLASVWNSAIPTSTVFSTGTAIPSGDYVAYCWAAVAGYSAFGSYTGNGSADGPFIYLGFRPRYLLIKSSVVAGGTWVVFDSARSTYNVTGEKLAPNTADSENSGATGIAGGVDFLSNGFKIRLSWGDINTSNTLIYAAFGENPTKFANAR